MRNLGVLVTGVMAAAIVACSAGSDSASSASDLTESTDAAVATDGGGDAAASDADAASDAAVDATADGSAPAIPTYAEVAPILEAACATCHDSQFATLADVKDQSLTMLSQVNRGRMPKRNPTWKDTPDGQKLIAYLTFSPDVQ